MIRRPFSEGGPAGESHVPSAHGEEAETLFIRGLLRASFAKGGPQSHELESSTSGSSRPTDPAVRHTDRPHDPAVVGAAVLLGRLIHHAPGLVRGSDGDAVVVIVEVADAAWIEPMAEAVIACFESGRGVLKAAGLGGLEIADETHGRSVVVAPRPDWGPTSHHEKEVAKAFRHHRTLVGITTPSGRGLPEDLLHACQERLVLKPFDPTSLELVLEHVVGSRSGLPVPDEIAAAVSPADLRIAFHPARGAVGSRERLVAVVCNRSKAGQASDGPKLDRLAGYGRAREWGLAAAADLAAYGRGELPWTECEPGVLLAGPPGTGKTMFAGAVARQAGVPVVAGSLAQWQSVGEAHLGTTLKAMRAFFDAAREASPCVALVDELDSFGSRMGSRNSNRDYHTQVVNAFLECLDGIQVRPGVLLVGTTNNPERIDPAILRAGRFDRCMVIPLPSVEDLAEILRHHLGADLASADLVDVARRALGGTGADCAAWVRRARGRARREGRSLLIEDLVSEIGAAAVPRTAAQDRRIAIHECGHAIVAHVLGIKVGDIVLDCAATGGAWTEHRTQSVFATGNELHDHLAACLAGRAAEILVYGSSTPGSASDLVEATDLCRAMHSRWGLGRQISVSDPKHAFGGRQRAVERDLRSASERAVSLLAAHRSELDRLADALVRRRVLDGRDLEALLRSTTEEMAARIEDAGTSTATSAATGRDGLEVSHDDPQ